MFSDPINREVELPLEFLHVIATKARRRIVIERALSPHTQASETYPSCNQQFAPLRWEQYLFDLRSHEAKDLLWVLIQDALPYVLARMFADFLIENSSQVAN